MFASSLLQNHFQRAMSNKHKDAHHWCTSLYPGCKNDLNSNSNNYHACLYRYPYSRRTNIMLILTSNCTLIKMLISWELSSSRVSEVTLFLQEWRIDACHCTKFPKMKAVINGLRVPELFQVLPWYWQFVIWMEHCLLQSIHRGVYASTTMVVSTGNSNTMSMTKSIRALIQCL
jgi:hypothetical protein